MSVLHRPQNANNPEPGPPGHRRLTIIAALAMCTTALLVTIAWSTSSPHDTTPSTPPPPTLSPYIPAGPPPEPLPSSPAAHDTSPGTPPVHSPAEVETRTEASPAPLPELNAPEVFFPEPEPSLTPLSEPAPEVTRPAPEPFDEEALGRQNANLGPRDWMARLPDAQSEELDEALAQSTQIVADELDRQHQQRMLYDEAMHIIQGATLRCALHDLSARARIVVHVDRVSLLDAHGRLFGVSATANIPAGGRAMRTCLTKALEGRHFALGLDDMIMRDVSFGIGLAK